MIFSASIVFGIIITSDSEKNYRLEEFLSEKFWQLECYNLDSPITKFYETANCRFL